MIWQSLRARARLAVVRVAHFLGPVRDSIRGQLNGQEAVKVLVKAFGAAGISLESLLQIAHDPDVQTVVLVPLISGLTMGLCSAIHHGMDGHVTPPDPPPAPVPPPAAVSVPAPDADSWPDGLTL